MNNYNTIQQLLEKFYEGNSSTEEEKILYDFFKSDSVPKELTKEKELYLTLKESSNKNIEIPKGLEQKLSSAIDNAYFKEQTKKKRAHILIRIAAVAFLFLGSYTYFNHLQKTKEIKRNEEICLALTSSLREVSQEINYGIEETQDSLSEFKCINKKQE